MSKRGDACFNAAIGAWSTLALYAWLGWSVAILFPLVYIAGGLWFARENDAHAD